MKANVGKKLERKEEKLKMENGELKMGRRLDGLV